ncbi:MAG: DNRLRE domain-containing protein, partial [Chloroflexota bacterium]|nr:DNRLRE domain-containing protein [Chloroflexota bacterium]
SKISTKGNVQANSWVEYDVTAVVTGNGTYSFNLATTSPDASLVYSRENATNQPQLVVVSAPSTTTVAPDADARVQEANGTSNYGLSGYLAADGGADPDVEGYLRFNVSGITGTVLSAKLRLYAYNGSANGPALYASGTTWSETEITWNNRPSRTSGVIEDKGAVAANSWVEYDVTRLVTGNGTYSFNLATTSPDAVLAYSRQHSDANLRPRLVLTFG